MKGLTRNQKKELKELRTKKGRRQQGCFMAEGVSLLEESLRFKIFPEEICYCEAMMNLRGQRLLSKFRRSEVPLIKIAADDLNYISGTETSQGLLGVFRIPPFTLEKLLKPGSRVLVLDNISDPGNAGTLIRSAAAFGFDFVAVTNYSVEPYNPKVVRSSAGTIFAIPIAVVEIEELLTVKRQFRVPLVTADIRGTGLRTSLQRIDRRRSFMVAIGSEATGISKKLNEVADFKVRIKHDKRVESLNAAVAGSIIMKEVYEL